MAGKRASTVPQHYDEEAGLHYIKGTRNILFENGVIIPRKDYDDRARSGKSLSSLIIEAMQQPKNCGWDYKNAVETTYLERMKGDKKMDIAPAIPEQPVVPAVEVVRAPDPAPVEVKTPEPKVPDVVESATRARNKIAEFLSKPYTDIIIMLAVVGTLCVSMSIYHTNKFLLDSGKDPWVAMVAAVAMVIFSASAFTAARHVFADKGINIISRLVFSSFLIVFGVFVIMYSVFSTTSVSYDQYREKRSLVVQSAVKEDTGVKLNDERVTAKDSAIAAAQAEVSRYELDSVGFYTAMMKDVPQLSSSEDAAAVEASRRAQQIALNARSLATKNYDKVQEQLATARERLNKLQEERYALIDAKSAAIDTVVSSQSTAYKLVSSKLGISEETLQFIIYVIPAAFFDVVAPFAVAIMLLLKDRRSCKEVRKEKSSLSKLFDRVINSIANRG